MKVSYTGTKPLSLMEKEEIQNHTLGLSDDERQVVLANMRTTVLENELDRRYQVALKKLEMINTVVNNASTMELTLVNMQKYFKELKSVLG